MHRESDGPATRAIPRKILRHGAFPWEFHISCADVGRAFGLDEETVRLRIRRMEDEASCKGGTSSAIRPSWDAG